MLLLTINIIKITYFYHFFFFFSPKNISPSTFYPFNFCFNFCWIEIFYLKLSKSYFFCWINNSNSVILFFYIYSLFASFFLGIYALYFFIRIKLLIITCSFYTLWIYYTNLSFYFNKRHYSPFNCYNYLCLAFTTSFLAFI